VKHLRARAKAARGGQDGWTERAGLGGAADGLEYCAAEWVESLRARNYAEGTLREREATLRFFRAWAAERDLVRVAEITRPVLEAYQRALSRPPEAGGRPVAWSMRRKRLEILRGFFRWLTRQNILLHNPASELELPRPEKRLPPAALTPEEVARLFAVPDVADPLGLRDRVMLEVFYASGLRRAELCRVECPELNLARGTLTVRQGKGKKDRVVPLGARAVSWLRRYLDEVRPRLLLDARVQTLFLTGYGEAFSPNVLTRMVTAWLAAAGLKGRGSCHLLRHTCATHMHEGGADIRHIQQLLGHACLETTAIYTDVTIRHLLEAHARCHPGARLPTDGQSTPSTP